MRNGSVVCLTILLGITLCSGLLVKAGQTAGRNRVVDPPMEQAQQIYIRNTADEERASQPVVLSQYPAEAPAVGHPLLRWSRVDGAVMYDVQILKKQEDADGKEAYYEPIMPLQRAYGTGCELALPDTFMDDVFYWRVQPMDLQGKPIGPFSDVAETYIDTTAPFVEKPYIVNHYNQGKGQVLLYPVYDWIAVPGADHYEVEILDDEPENPNGIEPSIHRIDAYTASYAQQYDQKPRMSSEPFYWRVRALDSSGNPIGVYSDVQTYTTNPDEAYDVAVFGDSISHGGGSLSYSPTDWEFSYASYLDFPTVNLAQSGDTSAMSDERFIRDVVPFHPRYVLILMGSNSLRAGVSASDVIDDLKSVKQKCLDHGMKPVFLTIPPFHPDHIAAAFDQDTDWGWKDAVAEVNAYIDSEVHIDVTEGMADDDGKLRTELAVDGLHQDPAGKKLMAQAINEAWPAIQELPDSAWEEEN